MIGGELDHDRRQVCALTEAEAAAIEAGDTDTYLSLLSDDARSCRRMLPPRLATIFGNGYAIFCSASP